MALHYYSARGHVLELAFRPVTRWTPFKHAAGTVNESDCRPMTKEQLHDFAGQGSRRVRHRGTRPKLTKAEVSSPKTKKGRAA